MRTLFNAAAAFVLVGLLTGHLVPGPHWRDVAADLHQAQPQAQVMHDLHALFQDKV